MHIIQGRRKVLKSSSSSSSSRRSSEVVAVGQILRSISSQADQQLRLLANSSHDRLIGSFPAKCWPEAVHETFNQNIQRKVDDRKDGGEAEVPLLLPPVHSDLDE